MRPYIGRGMREKDNNSLTTSPALSALRARIGHFSSSAIRECDARSFLWPARLTVVALLSLGAKGLRSSLLTLDRLIPSVSDHNARRYRQFFAEK